MGAEAVVAFISILFGIVLALVRHWTEGDYGNRGKIFAETFTIGFFIIWIGYGSLLVIGYLSGI
ncbi:MAG: hypothetical protein R3321_00415 [Nitrososphaeraceae archaeon]|nr:hypothetical protein [Nitrososphaeraceae archaeon]